MWQASCDDCGWHSQPASPKAAVREWARLHRVTCPLKKPPASDDRITVDREAMDAEVVAEYGYNPFRSAAEPDETVTP